MRRSLSRILATYFNDSFVEVFQVVNKNRAMLDSDHIPAILEMTEDSMEFISSFDVVESATVHKMLKGLKSKRVAGHDNIQDNVVKECEDFIAEPLTHIINSSL